METLSNLGSVYCFIAFIIGAMFMFTSLCIAAMSKAKKPRNNVHFYVEKLHNDCYYLLIKTKSKVIRTILFATKDFDEFGLNPLDFHDMKRDEVREVFLNLEG